MKNPLKQQSGLRKLAGDGHFLLVHKDHHRREGVIKIPACTQRVRKKKAEGPGGSLNLGTEGKGRIIPSPISERRWKRRGDPARGKKGVQTRLTHLVECSGGVLGYGHKLTIQDCS